VEQPSIALDDILQSGLLPVASKQLDLESPVKLRAAEPAEETIFPHTPEITPEQTSNDVTPEEDYDKIEHDDAVDNGSPNQAEEQQKQKKKATRGKRGGKKAKEKEQEKAEYLAKKIGVASPKPVEIISVAASESPQVPGPLQINSLVIYTDQTIGTGSCGTTVFKGSFEGRDVAVKRMLSQYYELASQEVSFLQQSDDHKNVVRYFCQQRDDHFLYIAVELCQVRTCGSFSETSSAFHRTYEALSTLEFDLRLESSADRRSRLVFLTSGEADLPAKRLGLCN
jgi:serine/threonine-protein kinase/endoribonuclease IRE1